MLINQPAALLSANNSFTGTNTFAGTVTTNTTLVQGATSAELILPTVHAASATFSASANKSCNAAGGALVMALPTGAAANGCRIMITKVDNSANTVTINPQAGGNIGGAANYVLTTQYQAVTLLCIHASVANGWVVVGKT